MPLAVVGAACRWCLWPNPSRGSLSDHIQRHSPWGFASYGLKAFKIDFLGFIDSAYYHFLLKSYRKVVPESEKMHSGASKIWFLKIAASGLLGVRYVWEMVFQVPNNVFHRSMTPRNDFGDVVKIMILGRFGHPQLVYLLSQLEK